MLVACENEERGETDVFAGYHARSLILEVHPVPFLNILLERQLAFVRRDILR